MNFTLKNFWYSNFKDDRSGEKLQLLLNSRIANYLLAYEKSLYLYFITIMLHVCSSGMRLKNRSALSHWPLTARIFHCGWSSLKLKLNSVVKFRREMHVADAGWTPLGLRLLSHMVMLIGITINWKSSARHICHDHNSIEKIG